MRDVGRKRLHEANVIVDSSGELVQRASQVAELVRARRAGKTEGKGPRRSAIANACDRSRPSGPTMVVAASAVSIDAATSEPTTTSKIRNRTSYRAARMRYVDCVTSTAPIVVSSCTTGSALNIVTDRWPGVGRVADP